MHKGYTKSTSKDYNFKFEKRKEKQNKKKGFFFFGGGEGIMGSWKQASNHTIITELKIEAQVLKSQHH